MKTKSRLINTRKMTKMETARAVMVQDHVFYACMVLNTRMVEDKTCETAWTDYTRIGYNPDFIESLDLRVVVFVLAHEVMHIVLKHDARRGARDPERWNIAADYAINIMLKDQGFTIWKHCLVSEKFRGLSAEQIYDILPKQCSGEQGGLGGDIRPMPPGMTDAEKAEARARVQQAVAQASTMAKARGRMPGDLEMILNSFFKEIVPWDDLLLDYMTRVVKVDENWSRRSRRYAHVVLPSRHSPGMNELIVIADSSGSMYNENVFKRIGTAIDYIIRVVKPLAVRVIWADDDECSRQEFFEPDDELVLNPLGGGGTDMCKPLAFIERYNPEIVILITDGDTPWPDSVPYPLIIATTTNATVPDYAQVVRITVNV